MTDPGFLQLPAPDYGRNGWQVRRIQDPIRRPWNGSTRLFERGDLETAWLVIAEYLPDHDGRGLGRCPVRGSVLLDRLEELGWRRGEALLYVIAASHWDGT